MKYLKSLTSNYKYNLFYKIKDVLLQYNNLIEFIEYDDTAIIKNNCTNDCIFQIYKNKRSYSLIIENCYEKLNFSSYNEFNYNKMLYININNKNQFINTVNKIYLINRYIPIRIHSIPTYLGIALSVLDLEKIRVTIYIGDEHNHLIYAIDNNDLLLIQLVISFVRNRDLQIIDYLQDKNYEISKLF